MHRDVMVAAARAGKHIFTEKVIAPTLAEVNQVIAAVEQAGVKLMVSLPRLYAGYTQAISEIIASGELGDLTLVRTRLAHNGSLRTEQNPDGWLPPHFYSAEQCGGGALIDLGCHPMYLARLFLGLPETVSAQFGYVTGREVEDNAVVTLGYPNGAIGIVEAAFSWATHPFTLEVQGTKGGLLFGTPEAKLLVYAGNAWEERALPADQPNAFAQWVGHIQQGTIGTANIEAARDLTRLMEAANKAAASGCAVRVDSLQA
jgi:predicted dehydrogenase